MSPEERGLCLVMAALLRRGRLIHAFSLPMTLFAFALAPVAVGAVIADPQGNWLVGAAMLLATLVVGFCEAFLAARVSFDADLFERLGTGGLDLAGLDAALARFRLAPAAKLGRSLDARLLGARRLLGPQLAALVLQLLLAMAWIVRFRLTGGHG